MFELLLEGGDPLDMFACRKAEHIHSKTSHAVRHPRVARCMTRFVLSIIQVSA
jgi:hypothetical protein